MTSVGDPPGELAPDEITEWSNGKVCDVLRRAEEEERALSARRRALHAEIDRLRDAHGTTQVGPRELQQRERFLSEQRHDLHLLITELRREHGRRVQALRAPLRLVEQD